MPLPSVFCQVASRTIPSLSSAAINAIRILVLLLPIAYVGARIWGLSGVFRGSVAADVLGACVALL